MPNTTFFQVLVDMKNSANVVPGVFAATGHDYRADLLPFFRAVLGIEASDEQMQRVTQWLEDREFVRSEWVKRHGTADTSLAASLVEHWMREDPERATEMVLDRVRGIIDRGLRRGGEVSTRRHRSCIPIRPPSAADSTGATSESVIRVNGRWQPRHRARWRTRCRSRPRARGSG